MILFHPLGHILPGRGIQCGEGGWPLSRHSIRSAGTGALFLTVIGAVSQLLGFGYRVLLSRMVGAEVMGLYQLIMPVYSVLLSIVAVGMTAAISNLTAQYLAWGNGRGMAQTMGTCLRFLFLLLLPVSAVVLVWSDPISVHLLGDARTQLGLVLLLPCVALTGVENFHKHCFYGAGRVHTPAIVDLLEQGVRTAAVLGLLCLFPGQYPERMVGLIVAGMIVCEVFSSGTLWVLTRRWWKRQGISGKGEQGPVRRRRVWAIAAPVGATALLGNLMSAANAALIPQKLVEGGMERSAAISQFGVVCGMTLPMLALPTVFLGALNLVLTPKLARSAALGREACVRRQIGWAVSVVSVLTLPAMAFMVVLGQDLGRVIFKQDSAGQYLLPLAVGMGLSCYESVLTCAMNGIGKQGETAMISIFANGVQLAVTLFTVGLPGVGMAGYAAGMVLSGLVGLGLLLWRLKAHTGMALRVFSWITAPGLSAALAALTSNLLFLRVKTAGFPVLPAAGGVLAFGAVLYLAALHAQGVGVRGLFHLEDNKTQD